MVGSSWERSLPSRDTWLGRRCQPHPKERPSITLWIKSVSVGLLASKQGRGAFCEKTQMAVTCSSEEEKLPQMAWRDSSLVLPLVLQVWVARVSFPEGVFWGCILHMVENPIFKVRGTVLEITVPSDTSGPQDSWFDNSLKRLTEFAKSCYTQSQGLWQWKDTD